MSAAPEVVRHDDGDALAAAVAERLVARLLDLQDAGRVPSVVLTGGTIAEKLHRAVAHGSAQRAGRLGAGGLLVRRRAVRPRR